MELMPSTSFWSEVNKSIFGRETYETPNGCKVTVKSGTGKVEVDDNGVISVSDAEKLKIYDSKHDDKIKVTNSEVGIRVGKGNDTLLLDKCNFNDYKLFKGGSTIITYGNKNSCANVLINGDFRGNINAQQGAGRGYGDDKDAHKDNILINGNNFGTINIDTHDKVAIKGPERGRIVNSTVYFI